MNKFIVAAIAAAGFTALSLGLGVPALAGDIGEETVTSPAAGPTI